LYGLFLSASETSGYHCSTMQPVVRVSQFPYSVTVTRLGVEIAKTGATLFCKLDQSSAAMGAGLTLRPTMLFIFGSPKAGAELQQAVPLAGLDLPLKLLVWEDDGAVSIAYVPARAIAERYTATGKMALIQAMDELLERLVATVALEASDS
jgi:uncharacterized protein (DUF302 family)